MTLKKTQHSQVFLMNNRDISHFRLIDWDFRSEDSRSFIHNFCWYPGRFIPIIPAYLVRALSKDGETVLDPYCGSGTTLLECLKLNRQAIGIDLNPMACFIANVKISVLKRDLIDTSTLQNLISEFSHLKQGKNDSCGDFFPNKYKALNNIDIPHLEENEGWYDPRTLKMLGNIRKFIHEVDPGPTHDLCLLFFYSILMPSSGHENKRPYTYYADNVKPKTKIYKDAYQLFSNKLSKFLKEYTSHLSPVNNHAQIFNDDVRNLKTILAPYPPIDLIVTSPPYLNVTDYTTAYRLVYLWDDFPIDVNAIKRREIGARWKRKTATRVTEYLGEINISLSNMASMLKKGGYIALILGEPKKHSEEIRSSIEHFAVNTVGLSLTESYSRNVSKNYFLSPLGGVPTEDILIFQRT